MEYDAEQFRSNAVAFRKVALNANSRAEAEWINYTCDILLRAVEVAENLREENEELRMIAFPHLYPNKVEA